MTGIEESQRSTNTLNHVLKDPEEANKSSGT